MKKVWIHYDHYRSILWAVTRRAGFLIMADVAKTIAKIRKNAKDWGVSFLQPLSERAAASAKAKFERQFGIPFPTDYESLLTFSDGLETQRGSLFSAADIQKWNEEHLHRIPFFRKVRGVVVFESRANPEPPPIRYVWIGSYGNMDMYSFHLASKSYRVTNLDFNYVYGEFAQLTDLLLYVSNPQIELAEPKPIIQPKAKKSSATKPRKKRG